MAALPYMQLYVADYLADTMHLTTEEHGAYLLLIFNYWQTGRAIPKARLARIARLSNERWTDVEQSLNEFFNDNGEAWVHERIERDLEAVHATQNQRSAAGKASAEARKNKKAAKPQQKGNDRSTPVEKPLNENPTNIDTDTDKETPPPREDFPDSRCKFAMHEHWEPDAKSFAAVLTRNGLSGRVFDQDQFLEFKSFWIASPDDHRTQAKWEHALAQHLKRGMYSDQASGRNRNATQQPGTPGNSQGNPGRSAQGSHQRPAKPGPLSAPDRVRAAIAEREAAAGADGQALDQDG
ncbi:DUF1376 domain-containing protein [Pseudomonas protegens]|uniref:DUF1376 domain-containing protein n=1 Tax=Pseudomonas protegens TaxID=380021 RepID=UPI001C698EA8|nr:DUF1376 domain-containing protein [Pseudomonas protegens]QYM99525.1 DUF1376 domain-containing protein [Pseudomonas protegens]